MIIDLRELNELDVVQSDICVIGGGGGNRTPVRKVSIEGIYMLILCFKFRSNNLPETGFNPS